MDISAEKIIDKQKQEISNLMWRAHLAEAQADALLDRIIELEAKARDAETTETESE